MGEWVRGVLLTAREARTEVVNQQQQLDHLRQENRELYDTLDESQLMVKESGRFE